MMGRSHALTGVLAAGATAYAIKADVPMFVLLCTTLPGTAILNDIDHPDSTVSKTYGPITGVLAKVLDHRKQTHSVPGVLAFSTLVYVAANFATNEPTYSPLWWTSRAVLAVVLILIWASTLRLFKIDGWLDDVAPIPFALAITIGEPVLHMIGISWSFPFRFLPFMLALGMLVHIVGDVVTLQPMPLWWPFSSRRTALKWFRAGGWFETWIMVPIVIIGSASVTAFWIMEMTGLLIIEFGPGK